MRILILLLLIGPQEAVPVADGRFTPVELPLLVKRFVASGESTAFSLGDHQGADLALAACDKDGRLSVSFSRSNSGRILTTDLGLKKVPRLLLADLDGDGRSEVLVGSHNLRIFRIGDAGLELMWTSAERFEDEPAPQLGVADFNQDGRVDVAVLNYKSPEADPNSRSLYVYMHQAGGDDRFKLGGVATLTDQQGFHSTSGLTVGDFLGDERPEVVVGNDNGNLWLLRINHDGNPVVDTHWEVAFGGAIGPGLAAGQLDREAKQELLVGTNGGGIFVYKFTQAGQPRLAAQAHAGRMAYGVRAGDLDGDGIDEFLLARGILGYAQMKQADVVTEVWKLGDEKLQRIWTRQAIDFVRPALMLKDFDGDGSTELVIYTPLGPGKPVEVIRPILDDKP